MSFAQQFPVVFNALNVGFLQTLKLFCVTLLGALPLGLLLACGEISRSRILRSVIKVLVWIIRGSPLMIQLLIIYYGPGLLASSISAEAAAASPFLKMLQGFKWSGGEDGRFAAAAVAFIINYACYFCEIFRGGIQGIPAGQEEAGLVLGMTGRQIFFQSEAAADGESHSAAHLQRDHYAGERHLPGADHLAAGGDLGRAGLPEGQPGDLRSHLAAFLHRRVLPGGQRFADRRLCEA